MKFNNRIILFLIAAGIYPLWMSGCSGDNGPIWPQEIDDADKGQWEIHIEKTDNTPQGHFIDIDITVCKNSTPVGGFDFLIGTDFSALAFVEATLGNYFSACGWEYFTYRFSWNGNCGNSCPSGLIRMVGIAETNNGANHPDFNCIGCVPRGETLVAMKFLVSNDAAFDCHFLPIRFYWADCGDNAMATMNGDTLAVNRQIFDYDGERIDDPGLGFPGYAGVPTDSCMDTGKVMPIRFIDFVNGGVGVACQDSIATRGDINDNGLPNEIADAVMFTNFFMTGLAAFGDHVDASVAASDVNADGLVLNLADLVYLIRIIRGEAVPCPEPPQDGAVIQTVGDHIFVNTPVDLGAAFFVLDITGPNDPPVLAIDNMDTKWVRVDNELRLLVYSIGPGNIPAGNRKIVTIPCDGEMRLVDAELATYEGANIETTIYAGYPVYVVQNYPNPFSSSTIITLTLPIESDWTIVIYNVDGVEIKHFAEHSPAGVEEITWDGTDSRGDPVPGGVYFYRVTINDDFSVTRWMVLIR